LLNSAVYTFLDDAPLEERRTRAVYTRRSSEPRSADDLGALDAAAIERVREEAWPGANTADELHDALMVAGYFEDSEIEPHWRALLKELDSRIRKVENRWFAVERKDDSAEELLASRLEVLGPVAAPEDALLLALEGQGRILRGRFSSNELEWCDRRLLSCWCGSMSRARTASAAPTAWRAWSSSSKASSSPRRRGSAKYCRRASPTTSRSRSTGCA
jgi:ATP-dependent Lhr-like helicase